MPPPPHLNFSNPENMVHPVIAAMLASADYAEIRLEEVPLITCLLTVSHSRARSYRDFLRFFNRKTRLIEYLGKPSEDVFEVGASHSAVIEYSNF